MKLLVLPLLLLGTAAGWLGLEPRPDAREALPSDPEEPRSSAGESCRATVECTERGTCIVTCFDESGRIVCQRELACDEPCEEACESPCELPRDCGR